MTCYKNGEEFIIVKPLQSQANTSTNLSKLQVPNTVVLLPPPIIIVENIKDSIAQCFREKSLPY